MNSFTRQFLISEHGLPPKASDREATVMLGSLIAAGKVDAATLSRVKLGCYRAMSPAIRKYLEDIHDLPTDADNADAMRLGIRLTESGELNRQRISQIKLTYLLNTDAAAPPAKSIQQILGPPPAIEKVRQCLIALALS